MRANPKGFTTDKSKILFALSFMTEGMPVTWALDFNKEVMSKNVWNFGLWANFKEKRKASFEDKEKAKNACTALHQLKQGTQTANAFFLQFELLHRAAGISDDGELVAFFEGGAIDRKKSSSRSICQMTNYQTAMTIGKQRSLRLMVSIGA